MAKNNVWDGIDTDALINPPPEIDPNQNVWDGIDTDAFFLTPEQIRENKRREIKESLVRIDKITYEKALETAPKGSQFLQVGQDAAQTPGAALFGVGLNRQIKETEKFTNIENAEQRNIEYAKQHPYVASLASSVLRITPQLINVMSDTAEMVQDPFNLQKIMRESNNPDLVNAAGIYTDIMKIVSPIDPAKGKATADKLFKSLEQWNTTKPEDEKGIIGLMKEKKYTKAADLAYRQALQSAPQSLMAVVLTAAGHPVAALATFGIPAYGQALYEIKDQDITLGQQRWNSLQKAILEAYSEVFGTMLAMAGGAATPQILKEAVIKQLNSSVTKKLAAAGATYLLDSGVEGIEEYVNKLGSNMVDIETGLMQPNQLFEGTDEAFVSGMASAFILEAPTQTAITTANTAAQIEEQQRQQELDKVRLAIEPSPGVAGIQNITIRNIDKKTNKPLPKINVEKQTDATGTIIRGDKIITKREFQIPNMEKLSGKEMPEFSRSDARPFLKFYKDQQRGVPSDKKTMNDALNVLDNYYNDYLNWYDKYTENRRQDKKIYEVYEERHMEIKRALRSQNEQEMIFAIDNGINQWHRDYPVVAHMMMAVDQDPEFEGLSDEEYDKRLAEEEGLWNNVAALLKQLGRLPERSEFENYDELLEERMQSLSEEEQAEMRDLLENPEFQKTKQRPDIKTGESITLWHNVKTPGEIKSSDKGIFAMESPDLNVLGGANTTQIEMTPVKTKVAENQDQLFKELFPDSKVNLEMTFDYDNIDRQIAKELIKQGFDSIQYTDPMVGNSKEWVILDENIIQNKQDAGKRTEALQKYNDLLNEAPGFQKTKPKEEINAQTTDSYLLQEQPILSELKEAAKLVGNNVEQATLVVDQKLTEEQKTYDEFTQAITGKSIRWVKNLGNNSGVQYKNRIYVDIKSPDPVGMITLHEAVHQVARTKPKSVDQVYNQIAIELAAEGKDIEAIREFYRKKGYREEIINQEVVAHYVGSKYRDKGFWAKMERYSPDFVVDLIRKLRDLINQMRVIFGNKDIVRRTLNNLNAENRIDEIAARVMGEYFTTAVASSENTPEVMARQNDKENVKTKNLDEIRFPAVFFMKGKQTSDTQYMNFKIDGKNLYHKDAPKMDIVLEEVQPGEFNIHDDTGKPDDALFFDIFDKQYNDAYNQEYARERDEAWRELQNEADAYKERNEMQKALKEETIPKEFRKKIKTKILPSRSKKSRLFGLLGNKNTSIPLFEAMFENWVQNGTEVIFEPYGGAFTLGTHALTKAINAGLKEFHSNVFDKEKALIIDAIKEGWADRIIEYIQEASDKFNDLVIKYAEKQPDAIAIINQFKEKHPDSFIGSSLWVDFMTRETDYAAQAMNFKDIYTMWRDIFQNAMNELTIDRSEVKDLKSAVNMAFSNVLGIFSGEGQSMIGSGGFKSYEGKVFHPKYGMVAGVKDTHAVMELAKEKGTEINIYSQDGAEFLKLLNNVEAGKAGIYLDPPYVLSAVDTYKKQASGHEDMLLKFIDPNKFIESHALVFHAADNGARVALTNDALYSYMKGINDRMTDPVNYIYKEGNTPTSLIADAQTENIIDTYFQKGKDSAGTTAKSYEDPEITAAKKRVRRHIHITQRLKAISNAQLLRIISKATDHNAKSLTNRKNTLTDLENILDALRKKRPDRIKGVVTITDKTAEKISNLKKHMINTSKMSQPHFEDIVTSITRREFFEPRYFHVKKYVTESQGKQILKAMLDSSSWIQRDLKIKKKVALHPGIKAEIDRITNVYKNNYYSTEPVDVVKGIQSFADMRIVVDNMEKKTGIPFGRVWMELIDKRHEAQFMVHRIIDKMHEGIDKIEFKKIIGNDASLDRINRIVASKLPDYIIGKPNIPEDATAAEKKIAKNISETLKTFETQVRYERFLEFYEQYHKSINTMTKQQINLVKGEWLPNAPAEAIKEAVRIYESSGHEALYNWLDRQTFAVIKTGYDIAEVIKPTVKGYERVAAGLSKAHLKSRKDIVYREQERNIMSRYISYVKQMVYRRELKTELAAWRNLLNAHIDKFENPQYLKRLLTDNIVEILGRGAPRKKLEKYLFAAYGQMARAIFLDPRKGFRNLLQNVAFHAELVAELKGSFKKLSEDEIRFFNTHISQMGGIVHDLLFQQYNIFQNIPVLKQLNQFADTVNMIGRTDTINRLWDYKMITTRLKKIMRDYNIETATQKDIQKMMKQARLGSITSPERLHALQILVTDGKNAFVNFVAAAVIKKDHFVYDRYMRSPEEQGSNLLKVLSNLTTFPKGFAQRQVLDLQKILSKSERELSKGTGAVATATGSIIWSTLIGSIISGAMYSFISGDDDRNPYSVGNIMLNISLGGIAASAQGNLITAGNDLVKAVISGDEDDIRASRKSLRAIPTQFLPLMNNLLNVIEATTNTKWLDSYAIDQLYGVIFEQYDPKDLDKFELRRDIIGALQHAIMGSEPTNAFSYTDKIVKELKKGELTEYQTERAVEDAIEVLEIYLNDELIEPKQFHSLRKKIMNAAQKGLTKRFSE